MSSPSGRPSVPLTAFPSAPPSAICPVVDTPPSFWLNQASKSKQPEADSCFIVFQGKARTHVEKSKTAQRQPDMKKEEKKWN